MKYILCTLLLLVVGNYCIAQKFNPALNLTKGNTYYLTTDARSTIIQTVSGQQNTANLTFSFKMAFKVLSVTDSIYNMEVSYQSLSMKMEQPDNIIDLDSKKNDQQDVPSSIFAGIINKPFNLELSKSGKIKSVKNFDKMVTGVLDSFPQIDTTRKQQVKMQFIQSFGPNAIKGSIEMSTAIFPGKPVAKGETWTVNTKLESPAKATVTINYQLADVIKGTCLIHGDGAIVTDKNAEPAHINGLQVKYDLIGSMIADIRVDNATGWVNEVKLKQVMMGDMQIPDNPSVPGGMTIPMTFNTEVITTNKQ